MAIPNFASYGSPAIGGPGGQPGGSVLPYLSQAQNQNAATIGGQYLNPQSNQYLQQYYNAAALPMIQQYQNTTAPDILGGAVQSGNLYGSAPQQQMSNAQSGLAQGLGNLAANIYEPAYQQERQLQQNAIGQAPGLAQAQYLPAQMLGQVGGQQQQLQQQIMGWPYQNLSGAAGLLGPATGGAGSVTVGGQGGLIG